MHTNEKKQKFIELRVKGESLGSIAKTLDVPRTTLWHWDKEEAERINELQLMEQDEAESIWLAEREERLSDYQMNTMTIHQVLVEKIETRAEHLPIKELFLYLNLLRSEMEHYRIKPLQREKNPANKKGIPIDEPAPSQEHQATIIPLPKPNQETVQNGTTSRENGTAAPGVESKCTTPVAKNSNTTRPGAAHPTTKAETVQNGTKSPQNGTAVCAPTLNSPVTQQSTTPKPDQNGTTAPAAPINSPGDQQSTTPKMVQNGTNSGQNGTAMLASANPAIEAKDDNNTEPKSRSIGDQQLTPPNPAPSASPVQHSAPTTKENQLPPKPTPPPERMVGHKIDPTKIVGRNTPLP